MGTIQKNSEWENRTTVQKGNIGEELVRRYFENDGWIIYPPLTEGSHLIDMYAEKNKNTVIAIDVKTKARRNKYPDTGIDFVHYERYKALSERHNMKVYIIFVDEMLGEIYGGRIDVLDKPRMINYGGRTLHYPWDCGGKRYWPLSAMRPIAKLNDADVESLKALSTRSYEYAE